MFSSPNAALALALAFAFALAATADLASGFSLTLAMSPTGVSVPGCGQAPSPPCVNFTYALVQARAMAGAANLSLTFELAPGWYNSSCGAVWRDPMLMSVESLAWVASASGVVINCRSAASFVAMYALNGTTTLAVAMRGFRVTAAATNATGRAGALHIEPTNRAVTTTLTAMTFDNNVGAGAGAVSLYGSATVSACVFTDNTGESGGALAIRTSSLVAPSAVLSSVFTGNSASELGGGIYLTGAVACTVGNVTVERNTALLGGGICANAVFSSGPSAPIGWGNSLRANRALVGGGLYLAKGGAWWSDSTFEANVATSYGGGFYVSRTEGFTLLRGQVVNNVAGFRGGGGFVFLTIALVMDTVEFDGNVVLSPASATDWSGGSLYIKLATGAAVFPRTTLTGSQMTVGIDNSGDAILAPSSGELFCDETTATISCVRCFASSCAVCSARSVGCVQQASRQTFCAAALTTEITSSIANVSQQVCSCGKSLDASCSSHGYCWWSASSRGYCKCNAAWVGSDCSFPAKVVIAICLTVGPVCIGGIAAIVYMVVRIRQNSKAVAKLQARLDAAHGDSQALAHPGAGSGEPSLVLGSTPIAEPLLSLPPSSPSMFTPSPTAEAPLLLARSPDEHLESVSSTTSSTST